MAYQHACAAGVFILLKKQSILKAKILIIAVFIMHISYACVCFPRGAGFHLYMLVIIPVSYVIFDDNEKIWKHLFVFIAFIFFFMFELIKIDQFQLWVPQLLQKMLYLGAVLSIIVGMTFVLRFYSRMLLSAERLRHSVATSDQLYNKHGNF